MKYTVKLDKATTNNAKCSDCGSLSILYQAGNLTCRDCGYPIYKIKRRNKYNASKQVARDGIRRDSKFEASVADELLMLKAAKEILDYDSQYKVLLNIYDKDGNIAMTKNWKIDFRVHQLDGTYKLLEAKGLEGDDYKWKRDILLNVWLPEHPDYEYEVRKAGYRKRRKYDQL